MASDEEIKTLAVKIAMDASSFTQQAAIFKRQLSELDSGFKASVAGISNWGSKTDSLKAQVDSLGQRINIQKQVVESYQGQIIKTNAALEAHSKQLLENRDKVAQLKSAYDQSAATLGKNADETKAIKDQLSAAEAELSKSEKQVLNNTKSVEGYTIQMNNANAKLKDMEAELKNANSALFDHSNVLAVAGTKLQSAGDKITGVGSKISGAGAALTMGVAAPIVGLGIAAEKTGMDFEAQMSRVQAVSGATGEQLKQLTDAAMDLGQKTTFSDQQVAEGMENLAQAGFGVDEIMKAMPGMLNLAASSGEDLASSADIAASTLRGFGLAADQAGHVADVLAKNAAQTNAAVSDTGLAMKYIAPLAQNAGWSLEQTTAAIGEMSNAGIKGEKAGTTLRGALTNLVDPSKEQADAMKEVGLNVYDANGKMNSLSDIIGQLQKGTASMTDAQRDNAVATIMGADALSGMQVLIQDGSGALDTMTQSLKDSDGASQDMADTMLNNTKGSIEQMKGSLENAGVALSKVMSPAVRDVADKVTDLSNKFSKLSPQTQENIVKFGLLAAAAGPVLLGLGKVTEAVGSSISVLGKGASGVANFVKGIAGIAPAAGEAVPLMTSLGLAIAANPVAGFAVAIGAAAAALGVLAIATDGVTSSTRKLLDSIDKEDQAWADAKKAATDSANANLAEIGATQALWDQLNSLVDSNGRVIGDNRAKVQELIDLINGAAGQTLLTMIDGQITRWNEARDAVNKYIDAQKAQILLDAHKDEYKSSLKNLQPDLDSLQKLSNEIDNTKKQIEGMKKELNDAPPSGRDAMSLQLELLQKQLQEEETKYKQHSTVVKQELGKQNSYQDAMAANAEGNYQKVIDILGQTTISYQASTGATRAQLGQQVLDMKNEMDLLVHYKQTGEARVSDAQIQAAQKRLTDASNEYDKSVQQAGAAATLTGTTYSDNLNATAGSANAAGQNVGQSAVNGANSKQGDANAAGHNLGQSAASGVREKNPDTGAAGAELGSSAANGVNSKQGELHNAGANAGSSVRSGLSGTSLTDMGAGLAAQLKAGWDNFLSGHPLIAKATATLESMWGVGHNASGTNDWRGGLTYINEKGGELVNLPSGTQIIPHDVSMEIARAVGQAVGSGGKNAFNVAVNIYGNPTAADGKAIAAVVSNELARQINARR